MGGSRGLGHSRHPASCRRVARAYASATMPPRPAAEAPRWHMMHVSPSSSGSMPASAAGLADDPALPSAVGRADAPPPCGEDALAPAPCTASPLAPGPAASISSANVDANAAFIFASFAICAARAVRCRCRRAAFSSGMIPSADPLSACSAEAQAALCCEAVVSSQRAMLALRTQSDAPGVLLPAPPLPPDPVAC